MIDRVMLKERAKSRFLNYYWPCVGIFVLLALLGGTGTGASFSFGARFGGSGGQSFDRIGNVFDRIPPAVGLLIVLIALIGIIAGIAVSTFVTLPIRVSNAKISIGIYDGDQPKFSDIFYCFKNGRYMKHVGTMLLRSLFISIPMLVLTVPIMILWLVTAFRAPAWAEMIKNGAMSTSISGDMLGAAIVLLAVILLMIPAAIVSIILSLGLSQTPYIAADQGVFGMGAVKKSWNLMRGHKGELFVLELSFIGWSILTGLTFGILGVFFTNPYINTTYAGFYRELAGVQNRPEPVEGPAVNY